MKNNAYLPSFVFQKTKLDESLESEIYGILQGYINNGIGATYKTLELIALKMASQKGIINFNASYDWSKRFLKEHGLSYRKPHSDRRCDLNELQVNVYKNTYTSLTILYVFL